MDELRHLSLRRKGSIWALWLVQCGLLNAWVGKAERDSLRYVAGVDLGTTFSAAAIAGPDGLEAMDLGTRTMETPSVVATTEDGTILTGEAAERRAVLEPSRAAREFKRRLGDPTPLLLGGVPYGAESLSGHLLETIVGQITERRGETPALVGLSHPANYGAYKLDLLEQAARVAGIEGVFFVPEPVAAAVHYSQAEGVSSGDLIAVYDLGGGTFDASVVRRTDDGFEVIGLPGGMERFGGIDMDEAVLGHVRSVLGDDLLQVDAADAAVKTALVRLREECRKAKEGLSGDTEVAVPVMLPGLHTEVRLTRAEFEDMIRPRIRETIDVLERTVTSAGATFDDLSRVLLVGGSSRIPLVSDMVRQATGKPVALDAHPKLTVALGTARATLEALEQRETPTAAASGRAPVDPSESDTEGVPVPVPASGDPGRFIADDVGTDDGPGNEVAGSVGGGARRFTIAGRSFPLMAALLVVAVGVIATIAFAMSGGDQPATTGAATGATSSTSGSTLPVAVGTVELPAVIGADPSDRVMAFYSAGYRNLETDGAWTNWDEFNSSPPDLICCDYYPELGPYSSTDTAVLAQHFAWFRQAGVGIVGYSWWGPNSDSDSLLPSVLDSAGRYGLTVAFVIEAYDGRDEESLIDDIAYLYDSYEDHPAFHWSSDETPHQAVGRRGVFLVRDPGDRLDPEDWGSSLEAVHSSETGAVVIAEGTDSLWTGPGGFDGVFNEPSVAMTGGFGWAATLPEHAWYVPTVLPGFEQERSGDSVALGRRDGTTYAESWEAALAVGVEPAFVAIASFNDWLAGTQIEPAASPPPTALATDYQDYGSLGSEGYLKLTAQLAGSAASSVFPETVALEMKLSSTSDWATVSIEGSTWSRPTLASLSGSEGSSWRLDWSADEPPVLRLERGSDAAASGGPVQLVLFIRVPSSDLASARVIIEQECPGDVVIEIRDLSTNPPTALAEGVGPEVCGGRSVVALASIDPVDVTTTTGTTPATATTTTTTTTITPPPATTTTTIPAATAIVPNLVGKSRSQAITELNALNLGYSETRSCYGATTDEVVGQSPSAGYVMLTGGGPDKTVFFDSQFATGCSEVPVNNVVGLTQAGAVAALEANGLVVSVNEGCHGGATPGNVVGQSPSGGTTAPQGWTVTINVQASGCG